MGFPRQLDSCCNSCLGCNGSIAHLVWKSPASTSSRCPISFTSSTDENNKIPNHSGLNRWNLFFSLLHSGDGVAFHSRNSCHFCACCFGMWVSLSKMVALGSQKQRKGAFSKILHATLADTSVARALSHGQSWLHGAIGSAILGDILGGVAFMGMFWLEGMT